MRYSDALSFRTIGCFFSFLFAIFSPCWAQPKEAPYDTVWVKATGEAMTQYLSVEEAKRQAYWQACENAVSNHAVNLRVTATRTTREGSGGLQDSFFRLLNTQTQGIIIDAEKRNYAQRPVSGEDFAKIIVTVHLKLAIPKSKRDDSFGLKVDLNNKEVFREGEEIILQVRATQDSYLTLFNVSSDSTVLLLCPNQYIASNTLPANKDVQFPSEDDRKRGIRLVATVSKSTKLIQETIVAIATRFPPRFSDSLITNELDEGLFAFEMTFFAMNRWLASIPLEQRIEAVIEYQVFP